MKEGHIQRLVERMAADRKFVAEAVERVVNKAVEKVGKVGDAEGDGWQCGYEKGFQAGYEQALIDEYRREVSKDG